jgi:hypothetical protein
MKEIWGYPAVYWAARIILILLLTLGGWLLLLACARYFRPRHIREMLRADLPRVEEFGAEFRGFKARVRFNAQATALNVLENRIVAIESAPGRLWVITEEHSQALTDLTLKTEDGDA